MTMRLLIIGFVCFFAACKTKEKSCSTSTLDSHKLNYEEINLEKGLSYQILFQSGDSIIAPNGKLVPSKENLDCNVFIPETNAKAKSNSFACLFISFETKLYDPNLGAGGGGMLLKMNLYKDNWHVIDRPKCIDYAFVGQTINNCGGKMNPNGIIFSAEEFYTSNKAELFTILQDTSDYNGKPITDNFGWIVAIDPKTAKATQKMTQFGKFAHEDALCTPDGKTVFLTNDEGPAALFKFETITPFDYSTGKLFAYSETKQWIELPNDYQSLLNIKNIAFKKGATAFTRHEWLTLVGTKLYITETGKDLSSYQEALNLGAKLPTYYKNDTVIDDPYGRILVLDILTNELKVELEGGEYNGCFFSNPDCITSYTKNGESYLIINEDIIGLDRGRSPKDFYVNEVFKYNLKTKELTRVMIAPKGSETTGGIFDSFGNYFVNIQHPETTNNSKFNKSTLVVIKGLQD